MIAPRWKLPLLAWLVTTVLCGLYYAARTWKPALRTEVGRETRLFGLSAIHPSLDERPASPVGEWLITRSLTDLSGGSPAAAAWSPPRWVAWCFHHPWSRWSSRRLTAVPDATWNLDGSTLQRVWQEPGGRWLDSRHIVAFDEATDKRKVLDLRTGRAYQGERMEQALGLDPEVTYYSWPDSPSLQDRLGPYPETASESPPPEDLTTLAPGLESLDFRSDGDENGHGEDRTCLVNHHAVYLLRRGPGSRDLYAVSDDPAPRVRLLAHRAKPLAISRNGRLLFFRRDGALWRLDLRKPLPELLEEVPVPDLPPIPGIQ